MSARLWVCRWNVARLLLAGLLLYALLADTAPRLARLGLSSLPDFDYAGQVAALRRQGRYGESALLGEAGLERYAGQGAGGPAPAIERELEITRAEQSSFLRRARDVGLGTLTGQGQTLESLAGAVGADLLVFGDVRDLVIQGTRLVMDGEADTVIVALSGLGLALTVAPEVDVGASVLKIARKSGALARNLGAQVVSMARRGATGEVEALAAGVGTIAKSAGPGAALRILRSAQSADDVARVTAFVGRRGKGGAAALHIADADGVKWLARGGDEALLVRASQKGPAGLAYAADAKRYPLLLRAHPLVGLTKGLWKGTVAGFLSRALDALGAAALYLLPLAAGWVVLEVWWLSRKWRGGESGGRGFRSPSDQAPRRARASVA